MVGVQRNGKRFTHANMCVCASCLMHAHGCCIWSLSRVKAFSLHKVTKWELRNLDFRDTCFGEVVLKAPAKAKRRVFHSTLNACTVVQCHPNACTAVQIEISSFGWTERIVQKNRVREKARVEKSALPAGLAIRQARPHHQQQCWNVHRRPRGLTDPKVLQQLLR